MVKPGLVDFLEWIFDNENRDFAKHNTPSIIAKRYREQTGKIITPGTVMYNLYKWLKINDKFYDIEKMPMDIFKRDVFKEFAIENDITIEDINGSIWENESTDHQQPMKLRINKRASELTGNTDQKESVFDQKESNIDQKESNIDQKESTIDQKELAVEEDQISK